MRNLAGHLASQEGEAYYIRVLYYSPSAMPDELGSEKGSGCLEARTKVVQVLQNVVTGFVQIMRPEWKSR